MSGVVTANVRAEQLHPGYLSGSFYQAVPGIYPSTTGITVGNNILYAHPLVLPRPARVGGLVCNVTTGAVGAARMGLYATSGAKPSSLIAEASTISDTNSISTFNPTFSTPPTLSPGIYWIGIVFSGIPTLTRFGGSPNAFGGFSWWIGTATAASLYGTAVGRNGGYQVAHTYGALPATFGTPTDAIQSPLMGWSHA